MITIETFSSVELTTGTIVSVEVISGSRDLLHLTVSLGEESPRSIVSGIRKYMSPEELEGKRCIIVSNLAPREMFGIESNGMLLCASYTNEEGKDCLSLAAVPEAVPDGTVLS